MNVIYLSVLNVWPIKLTFIYDIDVPLGRAWSKFTKNSLDFACQYLFILVVVVTIHPVKALFHNAFSMGYHHPTHIHTVEL